MKRALKEYLLFGVETSIPFCLKVMEHEKFISGNFDTHFIEKEFFSHPERLTEQTEGAPGQEIAAIGAVLFEHLYKKCNQRLKSAETNSKASRWKMKGRLSNLWFELSCLQFE